LSLFQTTLQNVKDLDLIFKSGWFTQQIRE
jgi:hypothetical protein